MRVAGPNQPNSARDAGRHQPPQTLLVANLVYGAWRAGVHGNPLMILLILALRNGDSVLSTFFFWALVGALILGTMIVVASVGEMRGRSWGRGALLALTGLDLCLRTAGLFFPPGGLAGLRSLWSLVWLSPSAALVFMNVAFVRRGDAPARSTGSSPRTGATHIPRRIGTPAVTARSRWIYLAPILVVLAWHWGGPFVTTARAARRGAEAGGLQGPPRIRSVWALPLYEGRTTSLLALPADARPAGMDARSYRHEYAPAQGDAFVLVFGEDFRRVADQVAENRRQTVQADGRPLVLENELPVEDALVEFRVTPTVNGFLRQPGPHTLQLLSGPAASSSPATLDLGTEGRRDQEWIQAEPHIHHVAAVGSRPGVLSLKVLVSGLCRPMPDRPGFCTPGFVSTGAEPGMEVPCALTVLGRREQCRWSHPNVLETEAVYGKDEDAAGFAELEVGGRASNRIEIRIRELLEPWTRRQERAQEYHRGVAASPAAAALGPAGLWVHLLGPAVAIALFLLMRGWRGQVVLKSTAALALPTLLISLFVFVVAYLSMLVRLPGSAAMGAVIESIGRDAISGAPRLVQGAVVGALVGLCLIGINRRRTA